MLSIENIRPQRIVEFLLAGQASNAALLVSRETVQEIITRRERWVYPKSVVRPGRARIPYFSRPNITYRVTELPYEALNSPIALVQSRNWISILDFTIEPTCLGNVKGKRIYKRETHESNIFKSLQEWLHWYGPGAIYKRR